jgi:hypothetical protein
LLYRESGVNEGCWIISGDEKLSLAGTTGDGGEMCAEVAQSFAVSRQIRVSGQGGKACWSDFGSCYLDLLDQ